MLYHICRPCINEKFYPFTIGYSYDFIKFLFGMILQSYQILGTAVLNKILNNHLSPAFPQPLSAHPPKQEELGVSRIPLPEFGFPFLFLALNQCLMQLGIKTKTLHQFNSDFRSQVFVGFDQSIKGECRFLFSFFFRAIN